MAKIEHNEEVDLWNCPCRECWALEQDLATDDNPPIPYSTWKEERT